MYFERFSLNNLLTADKLRLFQNIKKSENWTFFNSSVDYGFRRAFREGAKA